MEYGLYGGCLLCPLYPPLLVSCIIFTLLCLNRLEYGYESTVMCVRIDEVGIDWRAELQ